ncbi:MAG: alpha-glucan family phosphorylase [Odoribacteraceae bacterium]|jgi:phosphorylase/glycogen(starch) synthase|nr:alpha-glucan family phosphorylase [Odoribacteraceae bacterium]
MNKTNLKSPSNLFEVSWEVCNKVGGIHTVVSTKALSIEKIFKDNYVLVGPDVWRYNEPNPEFAEDLHLFKSWRVKLAQEGLRVRVGRWNIAGNPVVILVDFTTFITQKDKILSSFWEKFHLDSLKGQWDYIEPVLFGYAAGKVIEHFIRYNLSAHRRVVAHFHEWMTGSGLLYLKQAAPRVAAVFTTHATVLGRSIAGNGLPLYNNMQQYNPAEVALRFQVEAKQSLESKAAEHADCFTTVSEITAIECERFLGKPVDMVTPNGFENSIIPSGEHYPARRARGRERLLKVARAVSTTAIPDDALIIGISGRYEFKNKGIDLFIEALGRFNRENAGAKEVVAFILVPAGYRGIAPGLLHNMEKPYQAVSLASPHLTHELTDPANDPILARLSEQRLFNEPGDRVKVIFSPCYLSGEDGAFDLSYYDLLIGMDLTAFPSYYEPWGYTPLESLAFKVPTITTMLAGFGSWVETHHAGPHPSVEIIRRDDYNNDYVVRAITDKIRDMTTLTADEQELIRENAAGVSRIALWENLVSYYMEAYEIAFHKVSRQASKFTADDSEQLAYMEKQHVAHAPSWVSVIIHRSLPEKLMALEELAHNLWWSWNEEAVSLFKSIDLKQWIATHNPIIMLDKISLTRYKELEEDAGFIERLGAVHARFTAYMEGKKRMAPPAVAYFSMEYGLHSSLKIYSGGLGVLAGDYLKEASDKGVQITGIGLLYRYGYFTQKFSSAGNQEAEYEAQDFSKIPVTPVYDGEGRWIIVSLPFPGRILYARVWRVDVGRVELYLLDTDFEDNLEEDRSITHYLYGGNWENRLKQELLLGFGGVQALRLLGIPAQLYHCNEGHAAFAGVARLKEHVENEGLVFTEALEVVASSSLFTTHTPVPAGHDAFSESMLRGYLSHCPDRLKITWEQFLALGKINPRDPDEKFSMSYLAANLSRECNGVSWLHGKVSREIFAPLWPGYMPEELHIKYVTNGVHYDSWTAPEWKAIHEEVFGEEFKSHHYDLSCFEGIHEVEGERVMAVRDILRGRLIRHVKFLLSNVQDTAYFTPRQLVEIKETLREDILTIGFARRFATYKRAHLLFRNLDRLNEIVNNPARPVQFLFAGKAHPADQAGQDLIKRIVEISKYPRFLGKIVFIPNYDMHLARRMVQGVDVWMNTPTRPLEASGTSGQKAAMNGVMHFSVLDGWWVEGYQPGAGWALPMERAYGNQEFQDELDAEVIYNIIEDEIAAAFYERQGKSYSPAWVGHIKNTVARVASRFTTNRMLTDYEERYYRPMAERHARLTADNHALAIEIAEWKKKVAREWEGVEVKTTDFPPKVRQDITLGKSYTGSLSIDLGGLTPDEVGVELVVTEQVDGRVKVLYTREFTPVSFKKGVAVYSLDITAAEPGVFTLGARIYPKNPLLAHRQDLALVKWL